MAKEWQYIPGDNWGICDSCGHKFRVSQMRQRWDDLWVCSKDWEPRHPQDFVEARKDKIIPDVIKPRPADLFVPYVCTLTGRQGVVGYGTVGCAIVGRDFGER